MEFKEFKDLYLISTKNSKIVSFFALSDLAYIRDMEETMRILSNGYIKPTINIRGLLLQYVRGTKILGDTIYMISVEKDNNIITLYNDFMSDFENAFITIRNNGCKIT